MLSQVAREVFGGGIFYYAVQATTAMILLLAANTAYADFPRLSSFMARDRFMPRQFANQGDRLVFSNGVLVLVSLASVLLIAFHGKTHLLIPLYAVGVFLAFTLSQTGMVVHWVRLRGEGWAHRALLNGVGAVLTGIALVVIAATKFTQGAWIVVVLIPLLVIRFRGVHRHYQETAEALELHQFAMPERVTQHVVVPVADIDRVTFNALAYARSVDPAAEAVHVNVDPQATAALQARWPLWAGGLPADHLGVPLPLPPPAPPEIPRRSASEDGGRLHQRGDPRVRAEPVVAPPPPRPDRAAPQVGPPLPQGHPGAKRSVQPGGVGSRSFPPQRGDLSVTT